MRRWLRFCSRACDGGSDPSHAPTGRHRASVQSQIMHTVKGMIMVTVAWMIIMVMPVVPVVIVVVDGGANPNSK